MVGRTSLKTLHLYQYVSTRIAGIGVVVVGELGEDRGVHGVQDPSGGVMSIDPRKSRSHKPADDSAVFHLGPGAARTAVWRRAVMASRRVLLLVGPCRVDGGEAAATGDLGGLEDVDKARRTRRSFSRENGHPHQPRSLTLPRALPPSPFPTGDAPRGVHVQETGRGARSRARGVRVVR